MRATRNRVYRKLYRGFESPYLRQEFTRRYGGLIYGVHIGRGRTIRTRWLQGSGQARKACAVKGAHEQREWELQSPYLRQLFLEHIKAPNF